MSKITLPEFKKLFPQYADPRFTSNPKLIEKVLCLELKSPPKDIWPFIADTSKFNRALGLSPKVYNERNGVLHFIESVGPFKLQGIEEPWEWNSEKTISVSRKYLSGFFEFFRGFYGFLPSPSGGTTLLIYFGWLPSNLFGRLILRFGTGSFLSQFSRLIFEIDDKCANESRSEVQEFLKRNNSNLETSSQLQLNAIKESLHSIEQVHKESLDKLCDHIEHGDSMDLFRLQLKPLAKTWNVQLSDLLRTCLYATQYGLLNLSWDIVCPHCRGVRSTTSSLGEVQSDGYCDVCDVGFSTDEDNSIEVTFHIHPSIRKVEEVLFCSSDPVKKNHILTQFSLKPAEHHEFDLELKAGFYRVRASGVSESFTIKTTSNSPSLNVEVDLKNKSVCEVKSNSSINFRITNAHQKPLLFVVEEMWWKSDALLPGEVFSFSDFRQLFSREHLKAGVRLSLGTQTILFSDIVGSTKFYQAVGDAEAFREVHNHFNEIFTEVSKHNGAVVKTIGDSVMAAFPIPSDALTCALDIQKRFHSERTDSKLRLRITLHHGSIIAVPMNTGIDYFGSTVNYCAKMQSVAGPGEIAVSKTYFEMMKFQLVSDEENWKMQNLIFPGKADPEEVFLRRDVSAKKAVAI